MPEMSVRLRPIASDACAPRNVAAMASVCMAMSIELAEIPVTPAPCMIRTVKFVTGPIPMAEQNASIVTARQSLRRSPVVGGSEAGWHFGFSRATSSAAVEELRFTSGNVSMSAGSVGVANAMRQRLGETPMRFVRSIP